MLSYTFVRYKAPKNAIEKSRVIPGFLDHSQSGLVQGTEVRAKRLALGRPQFQHRT